MSETDNPPTPTTAPTDGFLNAGDVEIKVASIRNTQDQVLNIVNFIGEIEIYEDIFSPTVQGRITLLDSKNLIASLPLVGNEILTLWIKSKAMGDGYEETIKRSFYVYAIKNRILNKDNEESIDLLFCSLEAAKDNITFISKKFEGKTHEIAEQIFNDYLTQQRCYDDLEDPEITPIVIADTPHESSISFVANNWTPFQCLNYIAKRSIGNKNKTPTFLFYETTTQFYFTSIQALLEGALSTNSILSQYRYTEKNRGSGDSETGRSRLADYTSVESVSFPQQIDVFDSQDSGRFASQTDTFDLIQKKKNTWIWDNGLNFGEGTRTESYKGYDASKAGNEEVTTTKRENNEVINHLPYPVGVLRNANSKKFFKSLHFNSTNNNTSIPQINTEDYLLDYQPERFTGPRISTIEDFNSMRVNITVAGRTDMEVGSVVEFKYPRAVSQDEKNDDEESMWDPFISGIWLVTAIRHKINNTKHSMVLELAKDSFKTPFQLVEVEDIEPQTSDQSSNECNDAGGGSGGDAPGGSSSNSDQDSTATQASAPTEVSTSGWAHPTGRVGRTTSRPGPRNSPVAGGSSNHAGLDIAVPSGTPLYAAYDGVVTHAGSQSGGGGYGYRLAIKHTIDGREIYTVYGHGTVGTQKVGVGDRVTAGQHIMDSGNTGASSGPHLHFGIGTGYPINRSNYLNPEDYIGTI